MTSTKRSTDSERGEHSHVSEAKPVANARHWHQFPVGEVQRLVEVNVMAGLSGAEAKRQQKEFGRNRVTAWRGTPAWAQFLQQFNQPLVYILLAAVGVTAFLGEWVDSSVIFGVVIINAIVGFLQEAKAEKAIEALAKMVATETTVRRDGRKLRVHSEELVPGDVVLLQSGDCVPADLRLFHTAPIDAESWLRIADVATVAFLAVELEKWISFGGRRGERAIPE